MCASQRLYDIFFLMLCYELLYFYFDVLMLKFFKILFFSQIINIKYLFIVQSKKKNFKDKNQW